MLLDVIDVRAKDDFMLYVKFENGEERDFDCKQLFDKKPYQQLQNKDLFNQAKIVFGSVAWNDEIDIAPETLYYNA